MNAVAIIPARYGSTRFPGKPLAKETGKFLIQHVYERVAAARLVQRCLVATDDARIAEAVRSFGGEAVLTRSDHASGTDRIAEVVRGMTRSGQNIVIKSATGFDIALNVQGDEPEIDPAHLDRLSSASRPSPIAPWRPWPARFPPEADPRPELRQGGTKSPRTGAVFLARPDTIPQETVAPRRTATGCSTWAFTPIDERSCSSWPVGRRAPWSGSRSWNSSAILEHGRPMAVEVVDRACVGIDTPADYAAFVARWRG